MFDLSEKVVLVTGAAGGIGSAIVKIMHEHGAYVAISGTNIPALEALAAELKDRVHVFPCNLLDAAAVEKLPANVENIFNSVDILINNAGITRDSLLLRITDENWHDVISVNLEAPFRLMRSCVRDMVKKNWGRIINISSVVGVTGNAGQCNYTASKSGLIGLTKSLAAEVGRRGVTANCIAPGFISTSMTDKLPDDKKHAIKSAIPSGVFGNPIDVAYAALYLASPEASYVNGHTLHVNGGMFMN